MIRVRQIKCSIDNNSIDTLKKKVCNKLHIKESDIKSFKINKESIDARKELMYVYEIDIDTDAKIKYDNDIIEVNEIKYSIDVTGNKSIDKIYIIGSGPAGLFTAYTLSNLGYKVVVIERGSDVDTRIKDVDKFWLSNKLNINSNVQFGEGGAGTFSDGKLNTLVKDKLGRKEHILKIFVENGADPSILYKNKPHIGTDILCKIVKNMRNKIIENGGEYRFNSLLEDIIIKDNKLDSIIVNGETIKCNALILAIGHSARDTFKMLYDKKINMSAKPFALGVRIINPQSIINKAQYNTDKLGSADYKLTYTTKNNRGVYSFCMCPGGYVVNASSEENYLAINGMSYSKRDSGCANSAIVVTVSPKDYGDNPLDGIKFQRELESKAYNLGNGYIPIQNYLDYKNNIESTKLNFEPCIKGNYKLSNLNLLFPEYINDSLKEGIDYFNTKINKFNEGILCGIESRTSSPIRIERDDNMESSIKGIYPIGEGAGYAGGITTSAIEGLKISEVIASIYKN